MTEEKNTWKAIQCESTLHINISYEALATKIIEEGISTFSSNLPIRNLGIHNFIVSLQNFQKCTIPSFLTVAHTVKSSEGRPDQNPY